MTVVIGYDDKAFSGEKPTRLTDFWDIQKFPGPRAMRMWPKHKLDLALLADGVTPDRLYEVLGTDAGVQRAFRKLDQIKPHVKVWTDNWAQASQLLIDGNVAMGTGVNGCPAVAAQTAPHGKFFWDRLGYCGDMWAIVKGSKNRTAAVDFI